MKQFKRKQKMEHTKEISPLSLWEKRTNYLHGSIKNNLNIQGVCSMLTTLLTINPNEK